MIEVVYPENVQVQLDLLDEKIAKIYEEELPKEDTAEFMNYTNIQRIKRNLYERTRPLLDEKARLIQNCCPKYIVR